MHGTIGVMEIVHRLVALEPERTRDRSQWSRSTVELALEIRLKLKNVTQIHVQVSYFNEVMITSWPGILSLP